MEARVYPHTVGTIGANRADNRLTSRGKLWRGEEKTSFVNVADVGLEYLESK